MWALVLVLVTGVVGTACSTEEPLPPRTGEDEGAETSRRVGSLLAEIESTRNGTKRDIDIHAQFLDVRGVQVDEALEALEVWSTEPGLDRDTCTLRPGESAPTGTERDRDVRLDLLSVGTIDVEGPERSVQLEARRLPDLLSAFSGVIYGTDGSFGDEATRLGFAPGAEYRFSAAGDGSTGGFDVTLEAPTPVRLQPISGRWLHAGETVALPRGEDLKFRWNRPEFSDTNLYFDISTGYGPDRARLKCRLQDDGRFSVPADLIEELADEATTLQLSLRRVSSRDAEVGGLEDSNFSLSTVDRLTLQLH